MNLVPGFLQESMKPKKAYKKPSKQKKPQKPILKKKEK